MVEVVLVFGSHDLTSVGIHVHSDVLWPYYFWQVLQAVEDFRGHVEVQVFVFVVIEVFSSFLGG